MAGGVGNLRIGGLRMTVVVRTRGCGDRCSGDGSADRTADGGDVRPQDGEEGKESDGTVHERKDGAGGGWGQG